MEKWLMPQHEDNRIAQTALLQLMEKLADLDRHMESQCVTLGTHLFDIVHHAESLAETTSNIARQWQCGRQDCILDAVTAEANAALIVLQCQHTQLSNGLQSYTGIQRLLRSLQTRIASLNSITKRLRTIRMYFKVESSRSAEAERVFAAFSEEIETLVTSALAIVHNVRDSIDTAYAEQSTIEDEINQGQHDLSHITEMTERTVAVASQRISVIVSEAATGLDQAGACSTRIASLVNEIIVALQFRDITRQQLEHVSAALHDELMLNPVLAAHTLLNDENAELLSRAYANVKLQSAQLEHIISSVRTAYHGIAQSLTAIAEISPSLVIQHNAFATLGTKDSDFLALAQGLILIQTLLTRGDGLHQRSMQTLAQTVATLSTLSTKVDEITDINDAINLLALNAVVNAVRLGDNGCTLATLANEVTTLSQNCNTLTKDIILDIGSIRNIVREAQAETESSTAPSLTDLGSTLTRFQAHVDESACQFAAAQVISKQLTDAIYDMQRQLTCLPIYLDDLTRAANDMYSFLTQLAKWDRQDQTILGRLEQGLADAYTMESERIVHHSVMKTVQRMPDVFLSEPATAGTYSDTSTYEDFGDNVELF